MLETLVFVPHYNEADLQVVAEHLPQGSAGVLLGPSRQHRKWVETVVSRCQQGMAVDDLLLGYEPLDRLVEGVFLTGEVTPRIRRRLMDFGSQLSAQALRKLVPAAVWVESEVSVEDTPTLVRICQEQKPQRCLYWSSRPGLFTADPEMIPGARLLKRLDYSEAEELCRLGSPWADPAWLSWLERLDVPVLWKGLGQPDGQGTHISRTGDLVGRVRGLVRQLDVPLLSIESPRMWRTAGFLAELFAAFSRLGISVDLLATSQTNVTLTVDSRLEAGVITRLREALPEAEVAVHGPCAAVTLVGSRLRTVLPHLGPALEIFDEEKIHLVSQAASDLSLSFVVDQDQSDRLLRNLHGLLFADLSEDADFGPSGEQLRTATKYTAWWSAKREELLALAAASTPRYVYNRDTVIERCQQLTNLTSADQFLYAMKANWNSELIKTAWDQGFGLECVSPGEIELAQKLTGSGGQRILYTPNFAPRKDYEAGFEAGVTVTLDSLAPIAQWPDLFEGKSVFLRLDSGRGAGHHRHVQTGGKQSKFGITPDQFATLVPRLRELKVRVQGLHCHAGSGVMDPDNWLRVGQFLAETAREHFPEAEVLDLGGGLGVPDRTRKPHLDLPQLDKLLKGLRNLHPDYRLWLEPGRFLVAECGVILATVTQIKRKGEKYFVGLDTGMNSLIRPALYGAFHEIVNLTRLHDAPSWRVDVVGPICETGDILGRDRWLPACQPGDVFLIATAGAYGRVMSSSYNLRPPAEEIVI